MKAAHTQFLFWIFIAITLSIATRSTAGPLEDQYDLPTPIPQAGFTMNFQIPLDINHIINASIEMKTRFDISNFTYSDNTSNPNNYNSLLKGQAPPPCIDRKATTNTTIPPETHGLIPKLSPSTETIFICRYKH